VERQPHMQLWQEGERSSSQNRMISPSPQHQIASDHRPPLHDQSGRSSCSSSYTCETASFNSMSMTDDDNSWGPKSVQGNPSQAEGIGLASVSEGRSIDELGGDEVASDGNFSAIFPRRKVGESKKDTRGPVLITLDVLESMADVPLSDAARKLGVSSTAIKKACRKIGVQRWPYRKRAEGSQQAELMSDYNEAYVRKLFRKYSPKVPKVVKGKVAQGIVIPKQPGERSKSSKKTKNEDEEDFTGCSDDDSGDEESNAKETARDVERVGAKLRGIQMQGVGQSGFNYPYALDEATYSRESFNSRDDWNKPFSCMEGAMPWLMAPVENVSMPEMESNHGMSMHMGGEQMPPNRYPGSGGRQMWPARLDDCA